MGRRKVTIITHTCKGCGANLKINPEQKSAVCEYCGAQITIENEAMESAGGKQGSKDRLADHSLFFILLILGFAIFVSIAIIILIVGSALVFRTKNLVGKQVAVKQEIEENPFKGVKVQIEGMEPWARVINVTNGSGIHGARYTWEQQDGLSNGDVITITAEPLSGYQWTVSTYDYIVSGLNSVVVDVAQLSEEDTEMLYQEAKQEIERHWDSNLSNTGVSKEDLHLEITPYNIYINVNRDGDNAYFYGNNMVYPAFEVTFEAEGKNYTVYQFAEIDNVYITPEGSLHGDFNSMNASKGYIYTGSYGMEDAFSIWGFETVIKMESEMEDENFTLIK